MLNLITSFLMISAIGLSVPQNKVHYDYYDNDNYEYIDIEKPKEKLVSYDDEHNQITLSANELNNYHFNNLSALFYDDYSNLSSNVGNSYISYNDEEYGYDSLDNNTTYYELNYYYQDTNLDIGYYIHYSTEINKFRITDDNDNILQFEHSIIWDFDSTTYYDEIKQAIEADISANSSPSYQNILVEALELLTGGLTTIAAALGSGMAAYVEGLLISGTSMSAFASVIFLFGGIALAFALGRWVVNFIGSLGKRNR